MNFQRSYIVAACITGFVAVANLISEFNLIPLGIVVILVLPFISPVTRHTRLRLLFSISLLFAGLAVCYVASIGIAFARADSLSDFEGPNGEGSPIAPVVGLAFFALLFLIPWVLAAMRGLKSLRRDKKTEQVEASDS